jgi:hypothetical protein
MNRSWIIALTVTMPALLAIAQPQSKPEKVWIPAVYHGITIGKSTKEDAIRALGKPRSLGKEQDTGIPILTFDVSDPVPGAIVVYLNHGIVDGVTLLPKKQLTKKEVVQIFGPDYLRVRYAADNCLTEAGSAPLYESPDGPIEHLEYRRQGQAVVLHGGAVEAIVFVHKPFGPTHSRCAGKKPKKKAGDTGIQ